MAKSRRWDEQIFMKAQSAEGCQRVITQGIYVFITLIFLQLFMPVTTFYITPWIVFTGMLWWWRSRTAGLYLLYFSIVLVMIAVTDIVQVGHGGSWFNGGVALLALWSAVRVFDAASKLASGVERDMLSDPDSRR